MLITVVLLSPLLYLAFDKDSIHDATQCEIQEIYGLDEVLSTRVVYFVDNNPKADIDDLLAVKGIGKIKLEAIKKVFK